MISETLALYTGSGRPDLFITQGEAGKDILGPERSGAFEVSDYEVTYEGKQGQPGMPLEQIEDLGTWKITGATLTMDQSLTINFQNKNAIRTAIHEVGHADEAARRPLQHKRGSRDRDEKGKPIPWEKRPAEISAESYRTKVEREIK
jgi:hypothetical protein